MPITITAPRGARGLAPALRVIVREALALESRRTGEIGILLTDDAGIRVLNRRWRALDRATDVLSFGYDDSATAASSRSARAGTFGWEGGGRDLARRRPPVTGDIAISLDRMDEQARRFRVTRGEELARLVIHGTLHLAGLEHRAAPGRRHMRAREAAAMRAARKSIHELERALRRLVRED